MSNTNALITVGMLSAIKASTQMNLMGLIEQFFLSLLPVDGSTINMDEIQSEMDEKYGFSNIPIGLLVRIATKNSQGQNAILTTRGRNVWCVRQKPDINDFVERMYRAKEISQKLAERLIGFISDHYPLAKKISEEEAKQYLIEFLSVCGISVLRKESFREMAHDEKMRQTARFIQGEKEAGSHYYDDLVYLTKGYMVYNAIYFFLDQCGEEACIADMSGVDVYLDTSILINMLNYDTAVGHAAVMDVINLVKTKGGKIKTFWHNVDETQGILMAYATNVTRRQTFRLEALKRMDIQYTTALSIARDVEENIRSCDVEIVETPKYGSSSDQALIDIEHKANEYFGFRLREQKKTLIRRERIENDIQSIAYLMKERGRRRPRTFVEARSLMISENGIMRNIYSHMLGSRYRDSLINLTYGVAEISSVLWLTSSNGTDLPDIMLLYSANAVLQPTDETIQSMLDYLDEMEKLGSVTPDMATYIRTSSDVLPIVSEMNDMKANENVFTKEMFEELEKKLISDKAKDIADKEVEIRIKDRNEEVKRAKEEAERVASEYKAYRESVQKEEIKRANLKRSIAEDSTNEAREKAIKLDKFLSVAMITVFIAGIVTIVALTIIDGAQKNNTELREYMNSLTLVEIALLIISALGIIDLMCVGRSYLRKAIRHIVSKYEDREYSKLHAMRMKKYQGHLDV